MLSESTRSNTSTDQYFYWFTVVVLVANFIFLLTDLADDLSENMGLTHILPEIFAAIATLCLVIALAWKLRESRNESSSLRLKIGELENEATDWRQKTARYTKGLSEAIDEQMQKWQLSDAEKEVALLLLKGLSNKEIAQVRETSEQTVKQQSSSVYKKSGLASRSELSAFFLEDLLTPRAPETDSTSVASAEKTANLTALPTSVR
jgi:DNA-binding CsgD family transcriptional regulator